ncbi:acetylhydrolase [Paenibacillus sp. CAA11]|uniref:alpha/beta hydrolase family protein n=1 Tax=Paenibacillus sp. CAA11 TaxID=1532905 RepID=UPI000D3C14A3|nr:dienelactone hydrolase family protein [Paenibacillus sp. CAA11]AWB46578.1 acetylhydrolase [Paenibacillus sp. CAA11]
MRTLEILLVASCIALLAVLLIRKEANRIAGVAAGVACGGLLAGQLLIEGYRWKMIPAYLVAFLLIITALFRRRRARKPLRYTITGVLVLLLTGSVALSMVLPVFNLPKPSGEFKVGTEAFHFMDTSRDETYTEDKNDKRELIVQIWYPAAKSGGSAEESTLFPQDQKLFQAYMQAYSSYFGLPAPLLDYWKYNRSSSYEGADVLPAKSPYPVVLLSHGMGVGRILHTSQAENLASHGYIVVAVDHTYSTLATAFPDGRVTGLLTKPSQDQLYEDSRSILQMWNKDISFVVDQLEKINGGIIASRFKGKLDMNHIGIMGHSFGGAAAFEAVNSDPRIKAGVNMDGTLYESGDRSPLKKPFMFMESEEFMKVNEDQAKYRKTPITDEELQKLKFTRQQFSTVLAHRERELKVMDHVMQQEGSAVIYIEGAKHFNFTDLQLYSPLINLTGMTGSIQGTRGAEVVNRYVLEFFNEHLRGMKSKLLRGPSGDYPEVKYPGNPIFQD